MCNRINLNKELDAVRAKTRKKEDDLIDEVKNILSSDLLTENKVLNHLKFYAKALELIDETEVAKNLLYSVDEIKTVCINNRLRFLDSQNYKNEFPYEVVLKIDDLNVRYRKDLKHFKILAPAEAFKKNKGNLPCVLFAQSINNNYYLIHAWGVDAKWFKKLLYFPLRTFETLLISLLLFALVITVFLPVEFITRDPEASYWCDYRIGAYFHLLIFFSGITIYIILAFRKNLSNSDWNTAKI